MGVGAAIVGGAVIGGVATAYGAKKQSEAMDRASASQASVAYDNLQFAKEQWNIYETKVLPLELEAQSLGVSAQELALSRSQDEYDMYQSYYQPMQIKMSEIAMEGTEDRTEQVTRDAATRVSQEFERAKEISRRNLERAGVRPDSGRYEATDKTAGLAEAATRSQEINRAREGERDRQEVTNFNMLATAAGRAPAPFAPTQHTGSAGLNPSSSSALMANANTAIGNSALTNANAAGLTAASYGNITTGLVDAGFQAAPYFNSGNTVPQTSYQMGQEQTGTSFAPGSDAEFAAFKNGGLIPRYADGGKVDKPKKENAAVETAKENTGLVGFAARWLADHQKRLQEQERNARGNYADGGMVQGAPGVDNVPAVIDGQQPAKISSGEYVIPTDVVAAKGTEFFDKLLDSYHNGPTPGDAGLRGKA